MAFNVLITSLSNKVPLIREVRRALRKLPDSGSIVGADCNPACIGRYFVDAFWQMPSIDRLDPDDLVRYCQTNRIRAVIPTRDGELLFFAANREHFKKMGIDVMIADPAAVATCLDKLAFHDRLRQGRGIDPIHTAVVPDSRRAQRWVVKERFGAGSRNASIDVPTDVAQAQAHRLADPIFQPYVAGKEYSVDLYISQRGKPMGSVVRRRDVVINGESRVTTTVDRSDIGNLCLDAAGIIGLTMHALFQVILDGEGALHLVECNCRFGGASSLSVAAGLDSFGWFFRECSGDDLSGDSFLQSRSGLRQIRYAEDKIVDAHSSHDPSID